MYTVQPIENGLNITLSGSFVEIDMVCNEVKRFLPQYGCQSELFSVILGTRESLTNAVRYGCKQDSQKKIKYQIQIFDNQIRIRVTDPGNGFNWQEQEKKAPNTSQPALQTSGRGVEIFKLYFDAYQFNDQGNEIELIKNR